LAENGAGVGGASLVTCSNKPAITTTTAALSHESRLGIEPQGLAVGWQLTSWFNNGWLVVGWGWLSADARSEITIVIVSLKYRGK
jgi:hypothetical protein